MEVACLFQKFEPELRSPEARANPYKAQEEDRRNRVRTRGHHSREARKLLPFLIHRSGGGCDICGFSFRPALIPHHVRPLHHWGETDAMNLVALCQNCHAIIHYFLNGRIKDIEVKFKEALSIFPEEKARRLLLMSTEQVLIHYDGRLVLRAEIIKSEKVSHQGDLIFLGMTIPESKLTRFGREKLCQQSS